jgi:hypothetical protein
MTVATQNLFRALTSRGFPCSLGQLPNGWVVVTHPAARADEVRAVAHEMGVGEARIDTFAVSGSEFDAATFVAP